jgi:hypothetical protein
MLYLDTVRWFGFMSMDIFMPTNITTNPEYITDAIADRPDHSTSKTKPHFLPSASSHRIRKRQAAALAVDYPPI